MNSVHSLNDGKRIWRTNVTVFRNAESKANVYVPKGHCMMFLLRDYTPTFMECDDDQSYEIDCPENLTGIWPVALCVVASEHKLAWSNLSKETVGKMLDRIERGLARRLNGEPMRNGDILQ